MNSAIHSLPLWQLRTSATLSQRERRAHFDKRSIADLAASIATVGILQPLVVRPCHRSAGLNYLPTDPTHEIVAGERRFEAAKLAKLAEIPVTVRELTDEQVLEVQLVENLQRDDVHPMAEAEGYESLRKFGRSVDEIADKVGKSKAYVYARMKLLDLCDKARKAYYAGKLNASTALYVARVPMAGGLQEDALKEITEPRWAGGDPMSARDAQRHIHDNYMLRLSDAPFSTKDVDLVPAAGACGPCPHRTGNQAELFGDVKGADVCTSPTCFRAKTAAHNARAIEQAKASGQTVIAGAAAKKVAPTGVGFSMSGYVRLDDHNYDDSKNRTYRQILGKAYVPTLIMDERKNRLVEIAPEADLPKDAKRASRNDSYKDQQKAEQRKRELELKCRATVLKRLHERADTSCEPLCSTALKVIAQRLWKELSHDARGKLFKALDWPITKSKGVGVDHKLPKPIEKQTDAELTWTIQLFAVAPELEVWSYGSSKPEGLESLALAFGVDVAVVRKELQTEARDKARGKKRTAKMADNRMAARTTAAKKAAK